MLDTSPSALLMRICRALEVAESLLVLAAYASASCTEQLRAALRDLYALPLEHPLAQKYLSILQGIQEQPGLYGGSFASNPGLAVQLLLARDLSAHTYRALDDLLGALSPFPLLHSSSFSLLLRYQFFSRFSRRIPSQRFASRRLRRGAEQQ